MSLVGTITEFSFVVLVSERNLHRYISGAVRPGSEILESIYFAGISIDWLMSGNGCAFTEHAREHLTANKIPHRCCGGWVHCPFDLPRSDAGGGTPGVPNELPPSDVAST
ncbi:MAG: hypothetical protein IPF59_08610 [Ignavibacteria bacterium]|nr:hypothetical protein [Ignavibacteria bacterium]MBK6420388.1 hypothetical protein [Ignavibacteria bacterium]